MQNGASLKLPDVRLVTEALREVSAATGVPSISAGVNVGGQHLLAMTGQASIDENRPVTAQSAFRIACLVKFFGSLVCMQLAEEGRLDLDAPIGFYLPELNDGPQSKGQSILVRHLMTHTGGYRGLDVSNSSVWSKWSWQECVAFFKAMPQLFIPGTVFNEGHFDHVLLGQMLQRITGQLSPDLIKERIFAPLGIVASTVDADEADPERSVFGYKFLPAEKRLQKVSGANPPLEAWVSTLSNLTLRVEDLRRIGEALARLPGAATVFSPHVLDSLRVSGIAIPRTTDSRRDADWTPEAFNLSAAIFPKGRSGYLAVGKGQNTGIVMDTENQIVVAVALNGSAPPVRASVLDRVFSLIHGVSPGELIPQRRAFDGMLRAFRLGQIQGRYVGCFPDDILVTGNDRQATITSGTHLKISLEVQNNGRLTIQSRTPVPICFFPEPGSGIPSIMLGMYAFKKVA